MSKKKAEKSESTDSSASELTASPEFTITVEQEIAEEQEASGEEIVLSGEATSGEEEPIDLGRVALANSQMLSARIGALLFASIKPLPVSQIAELVREPVEEVEDAVREYAKSIDVERMGFGLYEVAGAWQFRTTPVLAPVVHRLIPPRARKLSRAAAETLAVVAYKQPVQRAEIEAIRGVDALPTLRTLLDARLIRVVGTEESIGRPALYGTTETFLEKFSLNDLGELPPIRELMQIVSDPGEAGTDAEEGGVSQLSLLDVDTQVETEFAEVQLNGEESVGLDHSASE